MQKPPLSSSESEIARNSSEEHPTTSKHSLTSRLQAALRFPRSWKDVRALGWKAILAFVLFYLIRDLILYVLIPYLIYRGVMN